MKRTSLIALLVGLPLVLVMAWVATHTAWVEAKVPVPLKGEALTNPFYAAQRFAEALGARAERVRVFTAPSTDAVIVLSAWHWNLTTSRREALERWVESGGRLVVDATLFDNPGAEEFERWSGIERKYQHFEDAKSGESDDEPDCFGFEEELNGEPAGGSPPPLHWICHLDRDTVFKTQRNPLWALRDGGGFQAIRVSIGRGSVTAINANPFRRRFLFDGDHAWLFAVATDLRKDDRVLFLTEDDHPSLVALVWQHGAPVVGLALALLACALWRGSVRFGPLVAPPDPARRSLAEQIRGTGQFALRHGHGDALHAAAVRALDETAARKVPGFARLSVETRATALAQLTGFDRGALAAALLHAGTRRAGRLRNAVALLETARRHILSLSPARSSHGTD
jgi:hypothetical protein